VDLFSLLADDHRRLDGAFLQHQEAVLVGDWEGAAAKLAEYRALLRHHMKVEEEAVLPLYGERAGEVTGGGADVFLLEHRRIEQLLGQVEHRLQETARGPTRRGTIALLDFERMFKDFVEHHSLREHNILYPKSKLLLTPGEQEAALKVWEGPSQ
jgi:hemerythrin-like domain-containing protein